MRRLAMLLLGLLTALPAAAQTTGKVVEEIIARVNNEIITLSDLQRAHATAQDEARQECPRRSEEHTSELQSQSNLVCRLLLEKKKIRPFIRHTSDYS